MTKVEKIVELVRKTTSVDHSDTANIVAMQDLLNVTVQEAQEVVEALKPNYLGRLFWLVTSVCGFDTFDFWAKYGYLGGYKRQIIREVAADFQAGFEENAREKDLLNKCERLLNERERLIDQRECDLEREVGKRVGEQVRILRYGVRALEERLERETAKNRRAKAIIRLVERGA